MWRHKSWCSTEDRWRQKIWISKLTFLRDDNCGPITYFKDRSLLYLISKASLLQWFEFCINSKQFWFFGWLLLSLDCSLIQHFIQFERWVYITALKNNNMLCAFGLNQIKAYMSLKVLCTMQKLSTFVNAMIILVMIPNPMSNNITICSHIYMKLGYQVCRRVS